MTEDKLRRTVIAAAVAGTLVGVSLFGVIVYQTVKIAVLNKRIERETQKIAELEQIVDKKEGDLSYFESELGLNDLAYGKYGFSKPEDKTNHE